MVSRESAGFIRIFLLFVLSSDLQERLSEFACAWGAKIGTVFFKVARNFCESQSLR